MSESEPPPSCEIEAQKGSSIFAFFSAGRYRRNAGFRLRPHLHDPARDTAGFQAGELIGHAIDGEGLVGLKAFLWPVDFAIAIEIDQKTRVSRSQKIATARVVTDERE